MTGRPRPKIRAKVQQDSQSSLNSTESQPTTTTASTNLAIAVSDEDGQDLFAYRRQRMRSLADDPESTMRLHTPPILEDEDKRKKRRYKNKLPEWTRVQSWSEGGSEVEIEAEESRPASRAGSRAGSVSRSSVPPQSVPVPLTTPPTSATIPEESDSEPEENLPALDPTVLAAIQARHLAARALSGEDLVFSNPSGPGLGESEVGGSGGGRGKCQVEVLVRMDPDRPMTTSLLADWQRKRVFDAPRDQHLTPIYDTLGKKLGVSDPLEDLVLTTSTGTRIWSPYTTPDALKFGEKVSLFAYTKTHFEIVEKARVEVERARWEARMEDEREERERTAQAQRTVENEKSDREVVVIDDGSSDIEVLDEPPQVTTRRTEVSRSVSNTPVPTSATIKVTIRGKDGELEGSVNDSTTFAAVINWYAKKMNIPAEMPASGRGKNRVLGKKLKIDFDGDLFEGDGKVVDLDLDGGETLDIKYV